MSTFGPSYDAALDGARLRTQMETIRDVMLSARECGSWLTLREIAALTHFGEASISAQLRHLRKPQFGGYVLEKRRRGAARASADSLRFAEDSGQARPGGLWEYRMLPPRPYPGTRAVQLALGLSPTFGRSGSLRASKSAARPERQALGSSGQGDSLRARQDGGASC